MSCPQAKRKRNELTSLVWVYCYVPVNRVGDTTTALSEDEAESLTVE